ncbi:MAG: alpha-L-arabinofuranosidase, partial [Duncaniella sp.]|nr:alpha-L-arabinofuranosidase [Duncaniella sp.]
TKYTCKLIQRKTIIKVKLRIFLKKPENTVDLEHVSLFPRNNVKGLRTDLVQKLADLKPGVFRFPGGCIVEGTDLATRYQWKNTVGAPENRPLNENRWQYTFTHHFFPDYYQTYGLGFYEYFVLSELLGAAPLPVVNVGLSCQYQNHDMSAHVPVDELDPYIQDALDLIEFANGPVTSKWGALRVEMGHPEPFNLKYIGVGNEQWGPEYVERLAPFVKAIRAKYPEIKIIGSSGPDSEGDKFEYLWPEMKKVKVDLVDEHFYRPDKWFLSQGTRYDSYDREGPKVFAGEYACHTKGHNQNHFGAALCEAAFMTGLERNADVVEMATYAPLFAHVDGWQWRPDMIWFDNLRSMPTASYYVQQMYGLNRGSRVVPTSIDKRPVAGLEGQNGLFATTAYDEATKQYIVKIVNTSDEAQEVKLDFKGLKGKFDKANVISFHAEEKDEN